MGPYTNAHVPLLCGSPPGVPELPKGNVRHRHNYHNFELKLGETSLVKQKPKGVFLPVSAVVLVREAARLTHGCKTVFAVHSHPVCFKTKHFFYPRT